MEPLEARVHLRVKDGTRGPWQLPRWEQVSAGRTTGYGIHLSHSWIPSKLCRFLPWERGWLVQVGPRPRMRVQDRYVGNHMFRRRSIVALQEGQMLLSFPELDDYCQIGVVIGPGAGGSLPTVRDVEPEEETRVGTTYGASNVVLTPLQRLILATTFAYLLRGDPTPVNVTVTAAARCGRSEQAVKNALGKVRDRINKERWGPKLDSYEDLGHYLVHLTRTITWEDLPQDLR